MSELPSKIALNKVKIYDDYIEDYDEQFSALMSNLQQQRTATRASRLIEWENSELKKLYDFERVISAFCMASKGCIPMAQSLTQAKGPIRSRVQALTWQGCVRLPKKYYSSVEYMRLPLEYVDLVPDYIFPVYNTDTYDGTIKKRIRILVPNSLAPKGPVVPQPKWEVHSWE